MEPAWQGLGPAVLVLIDPGKLAVVDTQAVAVYSQVFAVVGRFVFVVDS